MSFCLIHARTQLQTVVKGIDHLLATPVCRLAFLRAVGHICGHFKLNKRLGLKRLLVAKQDGLIVLEYLPEIRMVQ